MADQHKTIVPEKQLSPEEEAEALASVRLAYQDLSLKQQKEEEKMKVTNPNKARQMERLGMGFSNAKRNAVSHSVMTDMQVIDQEAGNKYNSSKTNNFEREGSTDFFDDYAMYSSGGGGSSSNNRDRNDYRDTAAAMGFETIEPIESTSNVRNMFTTSDTKKNSGKL